MNSRPVAIALVVACSASLAAIAALALTGPSLPPAGALVVVRDGASVRTIATELHRAGVIWHPLVFRLWARARGRDRALQAGVYRFASRAPIDVVLDALERGEERPAVTIPEGVTLREIARLLATSGHGDQASFECVADDADFMLAAGVPGPGLEGYLFPDTYRFSALTAPRDILATMVQRFHERFGGERLRRARARHMTVHEVVTLASIVEKETAIATERPLIAAVFYNRLRLGMPLQSDPTVIYGLPDFSGDLTRADLERPSPYNTYTRPGLPPGPIANPGLAAIDAVLAPASSPSLYFVAANDGSHVFSETLADHNRAVSRHQRGAR